MRAFFCALAMLCAAGPAAAGELAQSDARYEFTTKIEGKHDKASKDVSGIACLPPAGDTRKCLIVDDESKAAQFLTIRDHTIEPGDTVKLVGKKIAASTLGSPPHATCGKGDAESNDMDGEAVAYAKPYFYVSGSHGCSRHRDQFQLSAFVLARIEVDPAGAVVSVQTTYRLSDELLRHPKLLFANNLMMSNGLNLEGIAVIGDRLYAGLRAPSLQGNAFLVSVSTVGLFADGKDKLLPKSDDGVIALHLGNNTGIRDLAALPNGRLLVLAGPAQEQDDVPYSLFVVEPRSGGHLEKLGELELRGKTEGGKAEAVAVLGPDRVLVFFDSLKNGAPREYLVKLY